MASPDSPSAKTAVQQTIASLPESASWEDVMYALFVRESIEAGLKDVAEGRVVSHEDAIARLRALTLR